MEVLALNKLLWQMRTIFSNQKFISILFSCLETWAQGLLNSVSMVQWKLSKALHEMPSNGRQMVPISAASQTSFLSLSFPVVVQYFAIMPNGEIHTILATASEITDLGYRHYLPLNLNFRCLFALKRVAKTFKKIPSQSTILWSCYMPLRG